jgi:integrase
MADGYARASGGVGVAMATSGPGATNMVTGIATAMLDSSPVVCITGQVSSKLLGSDAFQEVDITGVTMPITKHNVVVSKAEDIARTVREAFIVAKSGRPGPVLVDITKDAQQASTEFNWDEAVPKLPPKKIRNNHDQEEFNRAVELLCSMFNWAQESGIWKGENPASRVRAFKESKRERFLLPEEARAFFRALDAEPNETIRDYIYLSLFTGGRKANVKAMRWPQIDFSLALWTIPAEWAKEGDTITIPLLPPALRILEQRRKSATSEWVFPGSGSTGHLVEPKKCWYRILKAAGLSDLRLHDLRRTMGSWQAITGASLPIIGKSLGHAPGSTATSVYARLIDAPVRESMQKATNALLLAGKVQHKR